MRKSRMIFKLWHRSIFDTKSKNERKVSPKDRIYAWMINTAAPGPCFAYIYIYIYIKGRNHSAIAQAFL